MNTDFTVFMLDEDESVVTIREFDKETNKTVWQFAMEAPRYAKLYYALKDWFND